MEVLSLGLFYLEFKDAIREGDGLRVLRCYKYLLPLFRTLLSHVPSMATEEIVSYCQQALISLKVGSFSSFGAI